MDNSIRPEFAKTKQVMVLMVAGYNRWAYNRESNVDKIYYNLDVIGNLK